MLFCSWTKGITPTIRFFLVLLTRVLLNLSRVCILGTPLGKNFELEVRIPWQGWEELGSPGEMKSREVELDSQSRVDRLASNLFLSSCFLDTVFVTLLRTVLQTAISGVHKLLGSGRVPTSLTLLFWRGPYLLNIVVLAVPTSLTLLFWRGPYLLNIVVLAGSLPP